MAHSFLADKLPCMPGAKANSFPATTSPDEVRVFVISVSNIEKAPEIIQPSASG